MRSLPVLDLLVLGAYLAGVLGGGFLFTRGGRTSERFMAAGRSLPGWAIGLSIFGSYISSISFLANPGASFKADWNAFAFTLVTPIAAWVAVRWFIPFYRREGALSAYEHFQRRFGAWARAYAVICFLLGQVARTAIVIYLLALAISPLTGWGVRAIAILVGIAMTVYPLVGGIGASVWMGAAQSFVLVAGLITCLGFLLVQVPGGPGEVVRLGAERGKFGLGATEMALGKPTLWLAIVFGLATHLQNFGIDQSYVQRYLTARSARDAARSVWLGAILYVPAAAAFFFIGTALFALASLRPETLSSADGALLAGDKVFPHFIATALPAGFTGLVIAAICAASMDSNLSSMATLTLEDLYRRHVRPRAGEREALVVLRLSTVGWGVAGTAMALGLASALDEGNRGKALDAWWNLASVFSGGMLGLFLLGFLSRRAGGAAAAWGVASGVLVILWIAMPAAGLWPGSLSALRCPLHPWFAMVAGSLTILGVGLLVTRLERKGRSPVEGS